MNFKVNCAFDKMVPIAALVPHPKNANEHPLDQVEALAEILEYQGWRIPIKISNRSGFVTAGHGRILAAKLLNQTEIPADFQDYESEEQEIADLHADNAITLRARLDIAKIKLQIKELPNLQPKFLGIEPIRLEDQLVEINEKELDENILTSHECPSCGYEW